jgi:2-polyprenyl-3-methyl-5-hydroxy-6-metoxy-1,4-benzoquinol methylase
VKKQGISRAIEGSLADSFLLSRGRKLWAQNQQDWNFPLSFMDKVLVTAYLVLRDHSTGRFPPDFTDQRMAYENEISFRDTLPGMAADEVSDAEMRKPFWPGKLGRKYLADYSYFTSVLEILNIHPESSLLELGCGSGWMAEFLAASGYRVTATTLAPNELEDGKQRLKSLHEKGIRAQLDFLVSPMESIHQNLPELQSFDCAFVYEALHHAFSWEETIRSVSKCLDKQGWLVICNEPNWFHTVRSYRGALLSNTHEIGFRKSALIRCLKESGFRNIRVVKGKFGFYIQPFWIVAQMHRSD